jgi:hypothetical protein
MLLVTGSDLSPIVHLLKEKRMRTISLVVSILLSLFTLPANAQAISEHVIYEDDWDGGGFEQVECLDDQDLASPLHFTATLQSTVTPSGRLHFHENWRVEGIWASDDGSEWYAHGVWPYRENHDENWSQSAMSEKAMIIADPIGDNPWPKLKTGLASKFVQNGNGEVVTAEFTLSLPSCIGKGGKGKK